MTWIPLYLHPLRKVVCTPFRNLHFCSRDLYLKHSIQSRWAFLELHVIKSWGNVIPRDQIWYKQPLFYNSNFSISNVSASPFGRVFLEENQFQLRDNFSPKPRTSPPEASLHCSLRCSLRYSFRRFLRCSLRHFLYCSPWLFSTSWVRNF